ncbi:hypothetical protein MHYP_G00056270 [Metynnis hypsauchen]
MPRKSKKAAAATRREAAKVRPGSDSQVVVAPISAHVTAVVASHAQNDFRYEEFSRGVQCTCNSLMFLAVLGENDRLTGLDLDRVLVRGDALYTRVKRALLNEGRYVSDLLTFDELPGTVETDSRCYSVIKHRQRFGFLRDEAPQGMAEYETLARALSCLTGDTPTALLLTGPVCVAVFRDRAGRFGFFDPHCRTPDGLTAAEHMGTAVMLTFTNLEDLIDRLLILYQACLKLSDGQQYDLLPVSFQNRDTATTADTQGIKLNKTQRRRQYLHQKRTKKKEKSIQTEEKKTGINQKNRYASDLKFREKRKQYSRVNYTENVRLCDRTHYQKNPVMVSACLTGQYVHTCSPTCPDDCITEERKSEWICHSCHDNLLKGRMPAIASANKLQLAAIPPELCGLNILERHVIAKYVCFAKVISLPKGQQRAIKGAVVSVPSDVETTVNVLPRPRSESQLLTVKLKRRLCYTGHYQFQTISMQKVLSALLKLKELHSEYRDIVINNMEPDELFDNPVNDDDDDDDDDAPVDPENNTGREDTPQQNPESEQHDEGESTEQQAGLSLDTCLQPPDLGQHMLSYNDGVFCIAPAERNNPVSIFKVPKLEAMAFPVQFPTGENTFDEPHRHTALSPSRYFNARLFSADNRFARDTNYIFFAQFVTEMHLATASMSIQLRKAKSMTHDGRRINSALLQDKQELDKLVKNNEGTRFMQPLRGTPAYWEKTLRDLFAMLRQLGTPTFFCTFSAAEMRWPEVITAIKAQQGETVDFSALDWSEKCEILRSNPVTAMRMFEKRVEALMNLIQSPAQPIGEVIDYFYRVEFQQRGSPHIHCLFWVKDAPEFENDMDQDVCDFIDRYISCKLPDPNTDAELHRIVSEVQTHSRNHSKSCKKNNKHCRFGFPKPPMEKTIITRPRPAPDTDSDEEGGEKDKTVTHTKSKLQPVWDLLNDATQHFDSITQLLETVGMTYEDYKESVKSLSTSSLVIMEREPKDCWINGYNPLLLRAWDANMDIQFILNPYSCIMYILSYISKAEHEMSDYLKRVMKDTCPSSSERETMKQVMQAYSKNREVSAQEAVARTCSLKLKSSSRAVIFIPTDDNAVRMSLPMKCLQDKDPDDENVWMTGLAEKYMARPNTPEFENMCMAEFASEYRIVYAEQRKGKNVSVLQNSMGHIKKRTRGKPAIIRFARFSQQKHPEKFYGTLLKLYLPHRSSAQLKTAQFSTYGSFYAFASVKLPGTETLQRVYTIVNENREKYEKHSEAIEQAIENFEQNGPIEDAWTNLAPTNELIRLECMIEQEPTDPTDVTEQDDVPDYSVSTSENRTAMPVMEAPQMSSAEIRKMYQSLNETQAAVFYSIRDWCKRKVLNLNPEQFFYYVAGTAGTGKSHLIKSVYAEATKILQKLPCVSEEADISKATVLLTAFTGCASHNINGKTLHALLKLPRSLKPPYQGLGNTLDEMRANFSNVQIMIIDEISMVSKPLFAYVNWRLQQIKGNDKPFGNVSIMAVGDFHQLPPLGKAKPLCVYEHHVLDFWRDHFKMITLTDIMRQKDDLAFAELLNRLRVKQKHDPLSDADSSLIKQVIKSPEDCPSDALHIFATNKEVDGYNSAAITSRFSDITNIDAEDYKKDPRSGQMQKQGAPFKGEKGDLIDTLQVAVGARVMLTRNIDVQDGLVNGCFGTVAKIITQTHNSVPVVQMIGLELDNTDAGQKHRNKVPGGSDNVVYIEREEESLRKKGTVRRQFPLKLAFACTAHKVQGMTTHCAVVSLKKVFEPGMAYVALSRTTSLSGLHVIDYDEKKIFCDPEISAALENMPKADLHVIQPLLHIVRDPNLSSTLKIVHHNTEGLQSHTEDIKHHHELLLSDVLCLTETHLTGSAVPDCLQLNDYRLYKRNRHTSYSNYTHLSNKSGGGVAIYVKNNVQAHPVQYIQNVTDLEFLVLKVEAPKKALIAVVYRPPNYTLSDFLPNLDALLTSLNIMDYKPVVVCGDFNEDQLATSNKPILNLFDSRDYTQVINTATTGKNTLLDPVFISNPHSTTAAGSSSLHLFLIPPHPGFTWAAPNPGTNPGSTSL